MFSSPLIFDIILTLSDVLLLNKREGVVGVAYRELFPRNRAVLDTRFDSKDHLVDSVCNSSMFPFFSTNWPFRFARRNRRKNDDWDVGLALPRIVATIWMSRS